MKTEFIPLSVFCARHNLTRQHVYTAKKLGSLPEHILRKVKGEGSMLIDAKFIESRHKFREKVMRSNQEFFYEMTDDTTIIKLSRAYYKLIQTRDITTISVWFTAGGLFNHTSFSILSYKVPPLHWEMFRLQKRIRDII